MVPGLSTVVLVNFLLTTPVQFFFGLPFHKGAAASLRRGHFNMDVLVSLGTFAAYGYSVVFIVVALATRGREGAGNEQFETAAMLITFILLGKYLESSAKGRASSAITQLLTLQPPTALQLETCKDLDKDAMEVPVAGLRRGDVVKVLPGAQVPVDAVVLYGDSAVNESMITGESLPQPKRKGDRVVGGTINGSGVLYLLVTAVGADSTLAQIMKVAAQPPPTATMHAHGTGDAHAVYTIPAAQPPLNGHDSTPYFLLFGPSRPSTAKMRWLLPPPLSPRRSRR